MRLPRIKGRIKAVRALQIFPSVKSRCFFIAILENLLMIHLIVFSIHKKSQQLDAPFRIFQLLRPFFRSIISQHRICCVHDRFLQFFWLVSQAISATAFSGCPNDRLSPTQQNLDTYSTVSCGDLHPILFSAFRPSCASERHRNFAYFWYWA